MCTLVLAMIFWHQEILTRSTLVLAIAYRFPIKKFSYAVKNLQINVCEGVHF